MRLDDMIEELVGLSPVWLGDDRLIKERVQRAMRLPHSGGVEMSLIFYVFYVNI